MFETVTVRPSFDITEYNIQVKKTSLDDFHKLMEVLTNHIEYLEHRTGIDKLNKRIGVLENMIRWMQIEMENVMVG